MNARSSERRRNADKLLANWGIVLIALGLAIVVGGFAMAGEWDEDKGFIENMARLEITIHEGTSIPSSEHVPIPDAGAYRERLAIKAMHAIVSGGVIASIGLGMLLLARSRRWR